VCAPCSWTLRSAAPGRRPRFASRP
jgi:hypothetical protein